jgi:hypothetical protein
MRQWNLTTRTVGIEVHASQRNTSGIIKEEIKKADGVVAIATPRNYDQITKNWRTLEWLQSEVGIAFGVNKPLLIIHEYEVKLDALPKYLPLHDVPKIGFSRDEPDQLIHEMDYWMPYYRESVKKHRVDTFFSRILNGY